MSPGSQETGSLGQPPEPAEPVLSLRLYVAGDAPNSALARANLAACLASHPGTRYNLEIVDFLREPARALADGVIVTPTLVKLEPRPVQRIIGSLRETVKVLAALGLSGAQHV